MKLKLILFTCAFQLLVPLVANSEEPVAVCSDAIKNYKDVISCAEARSPDVQISIADIEKAKADIGAAGQWQNPEISAESMRGKVGGENTTQTDFALGVPIELGGKISARKSVAEGRMSYAEAQGYETRAKVKAEVFLKLHRLRQVYHEQEVIDEAIGTFTKLVSQFSRRAVLSPEQKISNTVFKMSKSDYEIRRAETVEELAALDAYFKVVVGKSIGQLKGVLPMAVDSWPDLRDEYKTGASPKLRLAEAELKTSQADLSIAQSEAWPTLKIGPSMQIQKVGNQSSEMYGLNVSFPIPVFNLNGGAKAAAANGVRLSETKKSYARLEEEKHREALLNSYNESKRVIQSSLSHKEIEGNHRDVEGLFLKGIVPSALVIEAHRTVIDLEVTRHQRELKALEAMLSIYTIDGTILEKNL